MSSDKESLLTLFIDHSLQDSLDYLYKDPRLPKPCDLDCRMIHQNGVSTHSDAVRERNGWHDNAKLHSAAANQCALRDVSPSSWPQRLPDLSLARNEMDCYR
ncbi:hypothetical protein AVEN_232460-1 [Araneus ventricosus]|uniref:Uncharacterized protein n=1 Tax=Araneus ventricosus TaxID=182803 RepID=A0A4Y2E824_ARAVE|nr:hypothetical protein AVEN_232460-1 [Araneus ventricosus]